MDRKKKTEQGPPNKIVIDRMVYLHGTYNQWNAVGRSMKAFHVNRGHNLIKSMAMNPGESLVEVFFPRLIFR